jgi:hypothetical protein
LLEKIIEEIAKRFPREKAHLAICAALEGLHSKAASSDVLKPEARTLIVQAIGKLKHISACSLPPAPLGKRN